MEKLGIYVHIPFCLKKCNYCDFVSFPKESNLSLNPDDYAYRVCAEIENTPEDTKSRYTVDSVYFGGGTPTCISADMIGRILLSLKKNFILSDDAEITIEANPETVSEKLPGILKFLGFNRISMGVQSLDDGVLGLLGRVHNSDKAEKAFELLRKGGFENVNLDLMFGVPGQTLDIWKNTVDRVIAMDPEHISFYSLQIEEDTPFYEEYKKGSLDIPSWKENREMYSYAIGALKRAGYIHYEISNSAKPGFECRHNLKYWTMKPYLGFGTSAHSFMDGKRFFNTDELKYVRKYEETDEDEVLERMSDFVFTELRLIKGVDIDQFEELFGCRFEDVFGALLEDKELSAYLNVNRNSEGKLTGLTLSRIGLDNTNPVMQRFIEAVYS